MTTIPSDSLWRKHADWTTTPLTIEQLVLILSRVHGLDELTLVGPKDFKGLLKRQLQLIALAYSQDVPALLLRIHQLEEALADAERGEESQRAHGDYLLNENAGLRAVIREITGSHEHQWETEDETYYCGQCFVQSQDYALAAQTLAQTWLEKHGGRER